MIFMQSFTSSLDSLACTLTEWRGRASTSNFSALKFRVIKKLHQRVHGTCFIAILIGYSQGVYIKYIKVSQCLV